MKFIQKIICNNIAFLKERKDLSVEEMARIMEVSEDTLNDLSSGIFHDFPVSVLFNIHRNFGVPPYVILGDDIKITEKYCDLYKKRVYGRYQNEESGIR